MMAAAGGSDDDPFSIIYRGLANGLKQNAKVSTELKVTSDTVSSSRINEVQRIKCEFQGEKRLIQIRQPAQYKELMHQIRRYYGTDLDVYHALSVSSALTASSRDQRNVASRIGCQLDLEKAIKLESLGRSSSSFSSSSSSSAGHSLHVTLVVPGVHEDSTLSSTVSGASVQKTVVQKRRTDTAVTVDRESPPPGTLPSTDGVFIPDNEEPEVVSLGGCSSHSGSHSSLDSSNFYNTQLATSQRTIPAAGEEENEGVMDRVYCGTFPMSRPNGAVGQQIAAAVRGIPPPNTFPRHGRRPMMPSTGSFSSLGSNGSSDLSMISTSSMSASSSNGSLTHTALLQRSPRSPARWKMGRLLGAGVFGQVFLCLDAETGKEMAIKQIPIECTSEEAFKEVRALQCEIQLLKSLTHDRIAQYLGSHEDANILSIFMEYVPAGSVKDQIKEYGPLTEKVSSKYTYQVLQGLTYLHQLMIVHRNIKGANILRDHAGNIKLSEFGLSKRLQAIAISLRKSDSAHLHAIVKHYLAPEVIDGKGYGRKADIWSLGCTLVEMLTGSPPWYEAARSPASAPPTPITQHKQYTPIFRLPDTAGPAAHHFLSACFQIKPNERRSAEELVIHKFVSDSPT